MNSYQYCEKILTFQPEFHQLYSLHSSTSHQLELFFEFQHDSRLYKGISVHVCIYLFMCNLMGIVNMVRLFFFIYLVPPCFSGF